MTEGKRHFLPQLPHSNIEFSKYIQDSQEEIIADVKDHISDYDLLDDQIATIVEGYVTFLKNVDTVLPVEAILDQLSLENFMATKIAERVVHFDPRYDKPENNPTVTVNIVGKKSPTPSSYDPLASLHNRALTLGYVSRILDQTTSRDLTHHFLDESDPKVQYFVFKP